MSLKGRDLTNSISILAQSLPKLTTKQEGPGGLWVQDWLYSHERQSPGIEPETTKVRDKSNASTPIPHLILYLPWPISLRPALPGLLISLVANGGNCRKKYNILDNINKMIWKLIHWSILRIKLLFTHIFLNVYATNKPKMSGFWPPLEHWKFDG